MFAHIALATALVFSPIVTDGPTAPTSIVSSDCQLQGDSGCATDYDDFWAHDAYDTFSGPLKGDFTDQQIKDAFVDTYWGTFSTAPSWGDQYVVVPSATYDNVFHVFKAVTTNPNNQQADN